MADIATHKIHLFKEDRSISCKANETLLEATLAAGLNHVHACGGQGKCSTCRVSVMDGTENCSPRSKAEQAIAQKLNLPAEIRLACQTKVVGDVSVRRMVSDKMDQDMVMEQFSAPADIAIGSQQKLSILFTDIENYTVLAEKFPAYDVVHVLSRYYRLMNDVITKHLGLISDVAGDGILAVFGVDKNCDNSVSDAVKAVLEMNEKMQLFNEYLVENFNIKFGIRSGIHFGNVIVGPFDTGSMKKIAVIGDHVNYASRIESANKEFGTRLLLSEEAYQMVSKEYPRYNSFETALKGKSGLYTLYELND